MNASFASDLVKLADTDACLSWMTGQGKGSGPGLGLRPKFWYPDPRLRRTTGCVVIGVVRQGLLTALKVVWGIFAAGSLALPGSLLSLSPSITTFW